jgi:thiamine pyrophosphokinase
MPRVTILIFANGDIEDVDWIRPNLASPAAILAANGGTRHLFRLQHLPDVVIGDLDSLPQDVQEWLEAAQVTIHVYPHDKNETDLELALLHAVSHFEDDIQIFGALGGRLDQTLANILLLAHPALRERRIELLTEHQRAWLVTGSTKVTGKAGDIVSLVPVAGDVLVKSTSGLRWPLTNKVLSVGPALGVSNEMTGSTATVEVESGILLLIHTDQAWQR